MITKTTKATTKTELTYEDIARLAAMLTTLNEPGVHGTSESTLYIVCDMNIHDYNVLRDVMLAENWVRINGHFVTLTEAGRAKAVQIDATMLKTKR